MTLRQQIGLRVKYFREKCQLTQEQLSEQAEITVNQLYRIESGKSAPSLDSLDRLARALHVHIKDLLDFPYPCPQENT